MEVLVPKKQGECPHCGNNTGAKLGRAYLYGTPVRTCPKCSGKYLETCYHEVEIDGFRESDVSRKASRKDVFISLAVMLLMLALNGAMYALGGRIFKAILLFGILSVVYFFSCVRSFWKVCSGKMTKELEKERLASQKRLENREYAHMLLELGYKVPEKYL